MVLHLRHGDKQLTGERLQRAVLLAIEKARRASHAVGTAAASNSASTNARRPNVDRRRAPLDRGVIFAAAATMLGGASRNGAINYATASKREIAHDDGRFMPVA